MANLLHKFEQAVRIAFRFSQGDFSPAGKEHVLDTRNIHPKIIAIVKKLFDDGHYSQATFEAFKFVDKEVERISKLTGEFGKSLMMKAFSEVSPHIKLNALSNVTEQNEQEGFKFMFVGGVLAIRNPRGHQHSLVDGIDQCLDHLSFASMLLKRLVTAGFTLS